ncbi:MAG: YybH family protein [Gemmatimonadaceae bacterium]
MIGLRVFRLAVASAVIFVVACRSGEPAAISAAERTGIEDAIRKVVVDTYDLTTPNVVDRLMTLYPETAVYSASSGQITTSRQELRRQIETFWEFVGSNMKSPEWDWTSMHVDVLARDAAVVTASYRIPHTTPQNTPHVIAGAWTAVFVKRGDRWLVIHEHLSDLPEVPAASPIPEEDHSGH